MDADEHPPRYGRLAPMEMQRSSTLATEEGAPISPVSLASPGTGAGGKEEGKADSHVLVDVVPDTSSDSTADGSQPPDQLSEQALAQRVFTIAVAGTGFLADAYDLFIVNMVSRRVRRVCVL